MSTGLLFNKENLAVFTSLPFVRIQVLLGTNQVALDQPEMIEFCGTHTSQYVRSYFADLAIQSLPSPVRDWSWCWARISRILCNSAT